MMLTAHFALAEFACRDGHPVPHEFMANVTRLANELEVLRSILSRPVVILSGYRTPAWNAGRGVEHSQHLTASAADIRVAGMSPAEVAAALERAIGRGLLKNGGVGTYLPRPGRAAGWVHYDVGPAGRRWAG